MKKPSKKDELEFCLTNLTDIIDICAHKKITYLDKERIYIKTGNIYEVLEGFKRFI
jgi:hypothetical protein